MQYRAFATSSDSQQGADVDRFRLSVRARNDLLSIIRYTRQEWGQNQALRYLELLEDGFRLVSGSPSLGRPADPANPQHRRLERGSHVILYKALGDEVLILRILHKAMLPARHRP